MCVWLYSCMVQLFRGACTCVCLVLIWQKITQEKPLADLELPNMQSEVVWKIQLTFAVGLQQKKAPKERPRQNERPRSERGANDVREDAAEGKVSSFLFFFIGVCVCVCV